jgi:hypothetical protein
VVELPLPPVVVGVVVVLVVAVSVVGLVVIVVVLVLLLQPLQPRTAIRIEPPPDTALSSVSVSGPRWVEFSSIAIGFAFLSSHDVGWHRA